MDALLVTSAGGAPRRVCADADVVAALRDHGVARIDLGALEHAIDELLAAWKPLLVDDALDGWPSDPQRPEGYVPYADQRHSFYIQQRTALPASVRAISRAVHSAASELAAALLSAILRPRALAPRCVSTLVRVMYYPPIDGAMAPAWTRAGAVEDKPRAVAHTDLNHLTILPGGSAPGLQLHRDGAWHDIAAPPAEALVLAGDQLEAATRGEIAASLHRVRNPAAGEPRDRTSIAIFIGCDTAPPEQR